MKRRMIFLGVCIAAAILAHTASAADLKGDQNWPGFRGTDALGIAHESSPPIGWNVKESKNIKWEKSIPGLAHSSPIVWGDTVIVTAAIAMDGDPKLKIGLYGDVKPADDDGVHEWRIYAFDRKSGDLLWDSLAHRGVPKSHRHTKASHANSTPFTDGKHIVALMGSEGLFCFTMDGELNWKRDLGPLDAGFFLMPSAQWGFAGSPIIHEGSVVVQCDVQGDSFLTMLDVNTGKELWRTSRDEIPTWSTPNVYEVDGQKRIVVNGYKHIGGYDFEDGREIWKLVGGGDIPVPTPIVVDDLIYISSAHGRFAPIYAIRSDATGTVALKKKADANDAIVWSISKGGSYMQTPLVYNGYLYNCRDNGSLTCYNARTGELMYKEKLGEPGLGFSASAVAANGNIYYTSEPGEIFVVKSGPEFELLARNSMNDSCMATPAISGDTLFIRTHRSLVAISEE